MSDQNKDINTSQTPLLQSDALQAGRNETLDRDDEIIAMPRARAGAQVEGSLTDGNGSVQHPRNYDSIDEEEKVHIRVIKKDEVS